MLNQYMTSVTHRTLNGNANKILFKYCGQPVSNLVHVLPLNRSHLRIESKILIMDFVRCAIWLLFIGCAFSVCYYLMSSLLLWNWHSHLFININYSNQLIRLMNLRMRFKMFDLNIELEFAIDFLSLLVSSANRTSAESTITMRRRATLGCGNSEPLLHWYLWAWIDHFAIWFQQRQNVCSYSW